MSCLGNQVAGADGVYTSLRALDRAHSTGCGDPEAPLQGAEAAVTPSIRSAGSIAAPPPCRSKRPLSPTIRSPLSARSRRPRAPRPLVLEAFGPLRPAFPGVR